MSPNRVSVVRKMTQSGVAPLADTERGSVSAKGRERIRKALTEADRNRLAEAVELCTSIFEKLGVDRRTPVTLKRGIGQSFGTANVRSSQVKESVDRELAEAEKMRRIYKSIERMVVYECDFTNRWR